ncbi:Protein OS-9 [Phytophthora citrophthora]|uniref:Protein OS-9 n=1 Tax=Phytophthora citrophthora TaxID=4793 RepID=A0AAD9LKQ4_9STRA|nr:Protein OS-9 [Phytophthora citrophthora]
MTLLVLALCCVSAATAEAFADQDQQTLDVTAYSPLGHELESDGAVVRCRSCGAPVALKKDFIDLHDTSKAVGSRHEAVLGDDAELFTFVNPSRAEFELAGFKKVIGLEGDVFSKKATVFDDYSWRDIRCTSCKRHLGWAFYHDELQQCINTQLLESIAAKRANEKLLASTAEKERKEEIVRKDLEGHCVLAAAGWWTYEVCYKQEVRQFHQEPDGSRPSDWSMGVYVPDTQKKDEYVGTDVVQHFAGGQHCDENGELRSTKVVYTCCKTRPKDVSVEKVDEPALCSYLITVCVPSLCETEPDDEQDSAENQHIIDSCKEEFDGSHADAQLPSTFATLRWSTVISEDSSELDWARRMQFAD